VAVPGHVSKCQWHLPASSKIVDEPSLIDGVTERNGQDFGAVEGRGLQGGAADLPKFAKKCQKAPCLRPRGPKAGGLLGATMLK
jgi:hypothetical protein